MQVKVTELSGPALDWAVAKCVEASIRIERGEVRFAMSQFTGDHDLYSPSEDWAQGGPLLDQFNVTTIRADDDFEVDAGGFTTNKRIPQWFAECGRWVGHSICTSYEGEHMDPTFMVGEAGGFYGETRLIAGLRAIVAFVLGAEVDVPAELLA